VNAPRRVLVALSRTAEPLPQIEAGRKLAAALAAPLHGLLVWPTPITPSDVARILRVAPEALTGMVLDVAVGDPAACVNELARAHPNAFVVMCAESQGRDVCGLGETVARALAESATGAVILRPGSSLRGLKRILVPFDGTPSTAKALAPVAELAERAGASLDVVMIEDVGARLSAEHGAMAPPRYVDQPQHEWPAFSDELVRRFIGDMAHCPRNVPKRFFLAMGHAAPEILRFAEALDSDLVTLVWHGCTAGEHGAIFRDVVKSSTRPLLVLRR
jgi:nucleotide-binding universal stress UspA family protein